MAYQALYRRYRSRRFSELRGQDHVVRALRNAVREGRVGHAYLFSGPRGTGKTSTARILAKALNCEAPVDGEPCLECDSCVAIEAGRSFDVHELDAASNNGVEAMRELIGKVALATPGRTKVYILDEVHMLSPAAENAFLKTLEEPPPAVVFVLATTDPQRVSPTIRSRTQHFDFHLLPADELEALVRFVIEDAELDVPAGGVEHVLRAGGGSARDTLSALDQLVAAGGVALGDETIDELMEGVTERDTGRALVAVAAATASGRDPWVLAEELLGRLRDVFLATMKAGLDHLADRDREAVTALATRMEPRMLTRGLEILGQSLVDMHQAPDQRICLEVALVRLTDPAADPAPAALLERIERLERAVASGSAPADGAPPPPAPAQAGPAAEARQVLAQRGPESRPALGALRNQAPQPQTPAPTPETESQPGPAHGRAVDVPSRDELTLAWGDHVLDGLGGAAKARFNAGRFVAVEGTAAIFALPNRIHRDRCEDLRPQVEAALAAHFGRPVPLKLVVEGETAAAAPLPGDEVVDIAELRDAPADTRSHLDLLSEAFPGSEVIEEG